MENEYGKIYIYLKNLISSKQGRLLNENDKFETFIFGGNKKFDFIVVLSKDFDDPRIEIQLSYPNDNNYIIIGEFYNFKQNQEEKEQIFKIIKSVLSNEVKISHYFYKDKLVKTSYEYSYFIDNKVKKIKETFNNKFLFPWENKFIIKQLIYDPWIITDFTQ